MTIKGRETLCFCLLIALALCQVCEEAGKCKICYNEDASGGADSLMECSYTGCTVWHPHHYWDASCNCYKINQVCAAYGERQYNETKCLRKCCPNTASKVDTFTVDQFEKCLEFNRALPGVIIGSIVCAAALGGSIAYLLICKPQNISEHAERFADCISHPCTWFYR